MKYIIHSNSERGFWHNKLGWVYRASSATKFNEREYVENQGLLLLTKANDAEWLVYEYSE